MIEVYGLELLQQAQRLSAMISDLFAHDKKSKKLLLLSVKERVPQQMAALIENDEREIKLRAMYSRGTGYYINGKRASDWQCPHCGHKFTRSGH